MNSGQRRRDMSAEHVGIWVGFSVVIALGIVFGPAVGVLSLIAYIPAVLFHHYWWVGGSQ